MTTAQNTVCWMVIISWTRTVPNATTPFVTPNGDQMTEVLAREVCTFKVPGGKDGEPITLGEYVVRTPRQQMSKVMLEEKVFDTWYSSRTVLLGDGKRGLFSVLFPMGVLIEPSKLSQLYPCLSPDSSVPQGISRSILAIVSMSAQKLIIRRLPLFR